MRPPPPTCPGSSQTESQVVMSDEQSVNGGDTNGSGNGTSNHDNGRNRTDLHEEAMFGAIDSFCCSPEQSYEQFVQSFTYFNPGSDVNSLPLTAGEALSQSTSHQPENPRSPSSIAEISRALLRHSPQSPAALPLECMQAHLPGENIEDVPLKNTDLLMRNEDEMLEVEELPEGTSNPEFLLRSKETSDKPTIKVDNFIDDASDVENENETEEDDDDYQPYVASFSCSNSGHSTTGEISSGIPTHTSHITSGNTSVRNDCHCHEEKPNEAGSRKSSCISEKSIQPTKIPNESDSESDREYDVAFDLPNPGEVLPDDDIATEGTNSRAPRVQQLDFSSKPPDVSPSIDNDVPNCERVRATTEQQDEASSLDEVEAFKLDEDFDYDNVVLTPKYTAEEMAILQNLVRLGPLYPVRPESEDEEESSTL